MSSSFLCYSVVPNVYERSHIKHCVTLRGTLHDVGAEDNRGLLSPSYGDVLHISLVKRNQSNVIKSDAIKFMAN